MWKTAVGHAHAGPVAVEDGGGVWAEAPDVIPAHRVATPPVVTFGLACYRRSEEVQERSGRCADGTRTPEPERAPPPASHCILTSFHASSLISFTLFFVVFWSSYQNVAAASCLTLPPLPAA